MPLVSMHGLPILLGVAPAALPADTPIRQAHPAAVIGLQLPAAAAVTTITACLLPAAAAVVTTITACPLPAAAAVTPTPACLLPAAAAIIGRLLRPAADTILQAAPPAAGSKKYPITLSRDRTKNSRRLSPLGLDRLACLESEKCKDLCPFVQLSSCV
jgi:hypothetical protein